MRTLERIRPLMGRYPGLMTFGKGLYGHGKSVQSASSGLMQDNSQGQPPR